MKFKRILSGIMTLAMAASCVTVMPTAALADGADDSLLLYLDFDNEDTAASAGKATVEDGTLTYTTGISGKAAKFKDDNTYIKLTKADDSSLLADLDEFTVSFWSNTDANSWYFYTAPNGNAQTYLKEQYVGILDSVSSVLSERYENSANTSNTRPAGNDISASVSGGAWKHIALVESADAMKIYVNGELKGTQASSVDLSDMLGNNPVAYIGRANWYNSRTYRNEYANGAVDEYKIYSKALTDEEVAAEYNRIADTLGNEAWENIKDNPRVVFADYFNGGVTTPAKGSVTENGTIAYSSGPDGSKALRLNDGANYLQIFDETGTASPLKGKSEAAIAFKASPDDITKTSWYMYAASDGTSPKKDPRNYIAALNIGSTLTLERYNNANYTADMAKTTAQTTFKDVVILLNGTKTEIYIDGELEAQKTESGSLTDILGSDPVTYIGYGAWWGEYTKGVTMDNIEIYDTAPIIDLGDTTHLESNLTLPTYDDVDGVSIEWTTSDATVITNTGVINRPSAGKKSATLTAEVTMGNISYTREFPVAVYGTDNAYDFGITVSNTKGVDIQPNMYGLFFEDISYSADGGLSAEKIENRNFEQIFQNDWNYGTTATTYKNPSFGWTAEGTVTFPSESDSGYLPLNDKNLTYAHLVGTKLSNKAYEGVYAKAGDKLNISFYAKSDDFTGSISAGVDGQTVEVVSASSLTNEWTKYTAQLTMTSDVRYKPFDVILSASGTVDLDMISCIPSDAVYGVFRKDLADKLKELNPGFLRFPGGCIIEGLDLANRYQWKKSVGPAEERTQNWTRWGGSSTDIARSYNQTLAIGYFEYLELCEYMECDPIPVLNVGLSCEYNRPKETVPVFASQVTGDSGVTVDGVTYSTEFYEYIQDALDLIEFCNGTDDSNEWVALRKSMGHDEPFDLTMLGIGNEQWQISGNQWHERYEAFESVIHKYYPDMKLISTSGPSSDDRAPDWDFSNAWSWIREKKATNDKFTYATDEHYYNSADWFFENTDRYDSYTRNAKVFAGEYAANGEYGNTIYSALAEAAAMTGFERNADVVYMASYAPLFCREGGYASWSPNMIWFDDATSYGKPDYYEQQMFMQNNGSYTLQSTMDKVDSESYFESVSYDENSKDVIIKVVNPAEISAKVNIDLSAVKTSYGLEGTTKVITLTSDNKTDTNTLTNPENVKSVEATINNTSDTAIKYELPSLSFVIFRVHTTEQEPEPEDESKYSDHISVSKSTLGNPIAGFDGDGNICYNGDPAPFVDEDGTVYLYVGHDTATRETYNIPEWLVYSSKDLEEWKYEGVAMTNAAVTWSNSTTNAWAAQVIKHSGKYYMYFTTTSNQTGGNDCIGVAESNSPTGPFVPMQDGPIVNGPALGLDTGKAGWYEIDPTVWIETVEGTEHIYLNWGNTYNITCELESDMKTVKDRDGDNEITKADFVTSTFVDSGYKLPDEAGYDATYDYREAPWIYRRKDASGNYTGPYYLFYAEGWREAYAYATTDDIMSGQWTYRGTFMEQNATSNTSHGGVFDFGGKTYYIYHNGSLPKGSGYRRVANIQEVEFNSDGTIKPLTELSTGINGWSTSIVSATGKYMGHEQFTNPKSDDYPLSKTVTAGSEDGYNTEWEIKPSKADSSRADYVSLQSVNKPGLYISASSGNVTLTQDADGAQGRNMTFITVKALNGNSDMVSFESLTNRGKYLTVSDNAITLTDGTDTANASFNLTSENAQITKLLKTDIPADDNSIIKNGGFENESLITTLDWTFPNSEIWYSGASRITDGENHYMSLNGTGLGQRVTLEANKIYKLTAKVKSTGSASFGFNNGDAAYPGSVVVESETISGTDWYDFEMYYDTSDGAVTNVLVYLWSDSVVTTCIDDVKIEEADSIPAEWVDVPAIDTTAYTAGGVFEPNAGNPIMPGYIGDPFIFKDDDGSFYVVGTTDGYGTDSMGGIGGIYNGVFIDNTSPYCIWYSKDLVNWECKTLLHENGDFPKEESVLWAPAMTKASNGKYYMAYIYKAYNCYLAEADSPLGPWRDAEGFDGNKLSIDTATLTANGIDTSLAENLFDSDIVTLSDGRTYLITMGPQTGGKNTIWIGRFAEDMKSFDKWEPAYNGGVFEGPGLFERDGKYYLTFSNGSLGNGSYRVDYAVSDDLWSGYEGKGTILQRNDAISVNTTGHSNSIKIGDDYYICYHRKIQVGSGGRSGAMEKMEFNDDGTIKYITPSVNGSRPDLTLTNTEKNLVWDGIKVMASSTGSLSPLGTGIKWKPEYAVDRNNGTMWIAKNTGEQWYEIDLGAAKEIGRVETFFEYHTLAYKYKLEYSTDGENWSTLSDKTSNTDIIVPAVDAASSKVTARYIRYTFPEGGVDVMRDVPVGIFEVGIYAAQTETDDNLLTNGGFETALIGIGDDWSFSQTGGWYVAGADDRNTEEHHDGNYSLMLNNGTAGQRVSFQSDYKYTLTAYVKGTSGKTASIGFGDGSNAYPSSNLLTAAETVNLTGEWQKVTMEYTSEKAQTAVICLMAWDSGAVYFDDVTLTAEGIPFNGGGVVNGDFTEGKNGWTITGNADTAVTDGKFVVSGTDYETRVSQTINGVENGVYNLTAYVKTSDIEGIAYVYAKTADSAIASTAIPQTADLLKIIIPSVAVTDGAIDVGAYIKGSATVTIDKIALEKAADTETRVNFLKGGEISKLSYVESRGGKFYRTDGTEADALQVMAENGFNLARIRVLNNPGKGHSDGNWYLPEYYQSEEDCLELARRAHDKGMQILWSFAYSDTWSDGENQLIPFDWQQHITENNLSGEDLYKYLEEQVYAYTKDILGKLNAQGTTPDYVALGNEMQGGLFYGNWRSGSAMYQNPALLARFLKAGAKAVRELAPNAKIVIHTDGGGKVTTNKTNYLNALRQLGSDNFDVIGASYYPYYDGFAIDTVVNDFNKLINEFDKDVIIMETGYNWTQYKPDGYLGQLQNSGYYTDIYGETQNGQRAFLTELYAKLKQVAGGRCIGDLYWDPVMIYDGGVEHTKDTGIGWAINEETDITADNVVPNSTIFDFTGKAVKGQLAMKYNTNSTDSINITGKISKSAVPAADTQVTFTVNENTYTVKTDNYGDYIVSVPYPENGEFTISAEGYKNTYTLNAPYYGVLLSEIDFDTSCISKLSASFSETGELTFDADYLTDTESPLWYIAVYGADGALQAVSQSKKGSIMTAENKGTYTIKAFLWDNRHKPLCECKEITATY